MILTCPNCETQFRVNEKALGQGGRVVRCASCRHEWHAYPANQAAELPPPPAEDVLPPEAEAPAMQGVEEPDLQAFDEALAEADTPDEPEDEASVASADEAPLEEDAPAEESEFPQDDSDSIMDEVEVPEIHFAQEPEEFASPDASEDDGDAVALMKPLAIAAGVLLLLCFATLGYLVKPEMFGTVPSKGLVLSDIEMRERKGRDNVRYIVQGRIMNTTQSSQPVPKIRIAVMSKQDEPILSREYIAADGAMIAAGQAVPFMAKDLQTTQIDKVAYLLLDLGNGAELMKRPLTWIE